MLENQVVESLQIIFFATFQNNHMNYANLQIMIVATLLWPSVGVKPNTWKK
jgi:cell shape-determining protein MreD